MPNASPHNPLHAERRRRIPSDVAFLSHLGDALADEDGGAGVLTDVTNTVNTTLNDADGIERVTRDEHRREFRARFDASAGGVPPDEVNGERIVRDGLDRVTDDGELSYVFDALDRLVQVKRGPQEELLVAYDGLGRRRLERRQARGGHVEDVVLEYDGANVIEESDRATGDVLVATTHAQGIDAPLVTTVAGGATFVLRTNPRGDVVAAAKDGGGEVTEEQQLDPWGERTMAFRPGEVCVEGEEERDATRRVSGPRGKCAVQAAVLGMFGLAGARSHAGTKLVDMRNRVYAPHLRGFLTRDPLGNVDSESLFAYSRGDPLNLRDPWGLEAIGEGIRAEEVNGECVDNSEGGIDCRFFDTPVPAPAPAAAPPARPTSTCDAECRREHRDTVADVLKRFREDQDAERRLKEAARKLGEDESREGTSQEDVVKILPHPRHRELRSEMLRGFQGRRQAWADDFIPMETLSNTAGAFIGLAGKVLGGVSSFVFRRLATLAARGPTPLVYGLYGAGSPAVRFARERGYHLLTDLFDVPMVAGEWAATSKLTLMQARAEGRRVYFVLHEIGDMSGVLGGTGEWADAVTSQELRFIRAHWTDLSSTVTFLRRGTEAAPPWLE